MKRGGKGRMRHAARRGQQRRQRTPDHDNLCRSHRRHQWRQWQSSLGNVLWRRVLGKTTGLKGERWAQGTKSQAAAAVARPQGKGRLVDKVGMPLLYPTRTASPLS